MVDISKCYETLNNSLVLKPFFMKNDIICMENMFMYFIIEEAALDESGTFILTEDKKILPIVDINIVDLFNLDSEFNKNYLHLRQGPWEEKDLLVNLTMASINLVVKISGKRVELWPDYPTNNAHIWVDINDLDYHRIINKKGFLGLIYTNINYYEDLFNKNGKANCSTRCPKCGEANIEFYRTADRCKDCGYIWF